VRQGELYWRATAKNPRPKEAVIGALLTQRSVVEGARVYWYRNADARVVAGEEMEISGSKKADISSHTISNEELLL
jgi:hypothetical protein